MTYGKPRMIDVEPSPLGDVVVIGPIRHNGRDTALAAKVDEELIEPVREAGGDLYTFHLATCLAVHERRDRRYGD